MSLLIPTFSEGVLIVVDVQPSFMKAIEGAERIAGRAEFLARVARLLDVPVLATVQNPARMGGLDPRFEGLLSTPAYDKMAFSCMGCKPFADQIQDLKRSQVVIVGVETHICVSQTAHHVLREGMEVAVCPDAVGARSADRHELGLRRLESAGAVLAHTEAVAYEWMQSADHPRFREALEVVKRFA